MSRRLRRRDREGGATLIEFAIVAPLLVLLIMGTIDFGFIFNDMMELRQGVRDGARQGAVANFGTDSSCPGNQIPGGSSQQASRLICRTRDSIDLDTDDMRVKVCLPSLTTPNTCSSSVSDYQSNSNSLVVCAMYPRKSVSGFFDFLATGVVRDRVVIRIEQTRSEVTGQGESDNLVTTQETPLAGQNWDFCLPQS